MKSSNDLQAELLKRSCFEYRLSSPVVKAFYECPRHEFVPSYYSQEEAYADKPLSLFNQGVWQSTISQPSFVLSILELLEIKKGHKVFEVGTGSGWNAALMSKLVGPEGLVVTMEIIPEVAEEARLNLQKMGIKNVCVVPGDATWGFEAEAPYDRMIFTASAPPEKMPDFVSSQCRDGGRVIYVQENKLGGDLLLLLEKHGDKFKCLKRVPCHFVSMTGGAANDVQKK